MTSPRPVVTGATTEQIEQSIARGDRPMFIAEQLRIPIRQVLAVRAAMDAINAEPDTVPADPAAYRRDPGPSLAVPAVRGRPRTAPCGTMAAYKRHRRHGEQPCMACTIANRQYWSDMHFAQRRRRRAATP